MDRYPLPPDILKTILNNQDPASPFNATLHITQHCNLRCEFCWHHSHLKRTPLHPYHIPVPSIIKIIKELAKMGTKEISLSAEGEPACHPNFADIVKVIKNSGMSLTIVTNFTLHSPKIATAYARADHLMINLAAFDDPSYQTIHAPKSAVKFSKMVNHIRIFSRLYARQGHPLITLGYVITKHTFRHIQRALNVARACGVATMRFKIIDPTPHTKAILLNKAERKELADKLAQLLKKPFNISHNLADILPELSASPTHANDAFGRCMVVSLLMDISENGTVGLCCQNKKLKIGNWKKDTLAKIWTNVKAKRLRIQAKKRIAFNTPLWQSCRSCQFAQIDHYIDRIRKRLLYRNHE